jgi:hypothetical protein
MQYVVLITIYTFENLWTTNGKIIMKEVNGTINETNTPEAFRTLVEQLAPTYQLPDNF